MPDNVTVTSRIKQQIQKIMAVNREGTLSVFLNLHGTDAQFQPLTARPVSVDIVQDLLEHYTDFIRMTVEVTPDQFNDLIMNYQNLMAHLLIRYKSQFALDKGDPLLDINRKVIIRNFRKLHQSYTGTELETALQNGNDLIPLELELLDERLYNMRKLETQFMATDVTMRDVILTVCKAFGIPKVHLVPPDNTRQYKNFVMPKMESMATVFRFLQYTEGLGVYRKGCNYYYSQGVLYIYPEHNTAPEHGYTTHIYNVGTQEFHDLENYHRIDEKTGDIHILSHDQVDIENIVQAGIENRQTGRVLYRTENVVDNWHSIDSSGAPVVHDDNADAINASPDIGMTDRKTVSSGKVRPTLNNPFAEASEVVASYKNRMALTWNHAVPLAIRPSFPMKFHYDEPKDKSKASGENKKESVDKDKPIQEMEGVLEKAVYSIRRRGEQDELIFGCTGELQLAVTPESPEDEK